MVIDLRALNKVVMPDAYPLPLQSDVIRRIRGKKYLTVMDARSFFYQFLVYPPHRDRFTIVSARGQERLNVATMGYRNSPQHVQRFMDRLLRHHRHIASAFIDDIIIYSDTAEQHVKDLEAIWSLFHQQNITISGPKSFIGYPSIELLGFRVDGLAIHTAGAKIQALKDMKFPENLAALEKFIGMTSFLRHLIPRFSKRINPLQRRKTAMLASARTAGKLPPKGGRKRYTNRTSFEPTSEEYAAFEDIRHALAQPNALFHQDPNKHLFLQIDASKTNGFSGLIFQLQDGYHWDPKQPIPRTAVRPLSYFSKTLTSAKAKYWPTELKVACLVWLVKKARTIIQSNLVKPVHVLTDHAATVGIANQTNLNTVDKTKMNMKLILASEFLSQFQLDVKHIPGHTNIVADALSRIPSYTNTTKDAGTLEELWEESTFHMVSETHIDRAYADQMRTAYQETPRWKRIIDQLTTDPPPQVGLPFVLIDGLHIHLYLGVSKLR
ncbi:hypothetical protein FJTKL_06972 [Diaporthe vaccinii]|uniref:Reverse transcriptase domain-containing protein n=1 Tax=Diaporthe vaccinii TaxID=105482 RepID=A0ABR4DPK4_9PEZI